MTTPISFNTPDRVIRFAMDNAGLLQDGDSPSSEQYAKYMPRLNDMINVWQTEGIKLWTLGMLTVAGARTRAVHTACSHNGQRDP